MGNLMAGALGQVAKPAVSACPSCRAENAAAAKFCPSCGEKSG